MKEFSNLNKFFIFKNRDDIYFNGYSGLKNTI